MNSRTFGWVQNILSVYIIFVFVQSLFFKFTDSPETQFIFATLDQWASTFLIAGLFNPGGIFSAKIIGSAELFASILFFVSFVISNVAARVLAALLSLAIISGAIFFHLFTPLGIVVMDDSGLLFMLACGVWISSVVILLINRSWLLRIINSGRKVS